MALTRIDKTGDGTTTVVDVSFTLGYLSTDYVYVYLDGNDYTDQLDYRWLNDTQIQLATAVADGVEYIIRRIVDRTQLVNDYEDGAILEESNLDDSFLQTLMILEEITDGYLTATDTVFINAILDMDGAKITNLADGEDNNDAVNVGQLGTYLTDAQALYDATVVNAAYANTRANNSSSSATNASNSATSASNSAGNASRFATNAAESALIAAQGAYAVTEAVDGLIENTLATSTRSAPIEFIDEQFDYTINGFNASIASYYVYHPEGAFNTQILIPDLDYTYDSITTETITLSSSWEGGYILARVLDPAGSGTYTPANQYTRTQIPSKTGLQDGLKITVSDLSFAEFIISDTATPLIGDITLNSGQVAVLQVGDRSAFNVLWFNADPTGANDSLEAFDNAAERSAIYATENTAATIGSVVVPAGLWNLSTPTTNSAVWFLDVGCEMKSPSNLPTSNMDNTEYLTGQKFHYASRGSNLLHIGDTSEWVEGYRFASNSISTMSVTASDGRAAIYGHSRASDRTVQGAGCIGVGATAWADQDEDFDYSVWAGYFEAGKFHDVAGNAFAIESNVTNFTGAIQELTPNLLPKGSDKYSVNLWTGGPVGDSGTDTPSDDLIYPSTAAMVVSTGGKPYGNGGFDKGIIFLEASFLNGSKEILAYAEEHKMVAYSSSGVRLSSIETNEDSTENVGVHFHRVKLANGSWVAYRMGTTQFAVDNESNLGGTGNRWGTLYSVNSPNVSSDETLKEQRSSLTDNEMAAAIEIAKLPRMFKWLDEIAKKGEEGTVYLHCSPMAQEVWTALEDNNLDPTSYGFIHNGGDDGGTFSIQPQELLWMICAAQQAQIEDIQTRLLALENK